MFIRSAIIGVGNIAAFIDSPNSNNIASHTKALLYHEKTKLVKLYEPNLQNQKRFKEVWRDIEFVKNLKNIFKDVDLVCIASPTKFHKEHLDIALKSNIKYILCEKPVVNNKKELIQIEEKLLSSDKIIQINLIRDFNGVFLDLEKKIKSNFLGKIISFEGLCNKGLLHNGIHLIGLISKLIGDIKSILPINPILNKNDINGDFIIETSTTNGHIKSIKNLDYSEFFLNIWFESGKIEITSENIKIFKKGFSDKFLGYNILKQDKVFANILQNYAFESLDFLLNSNQKESKKLLKKHLNLHKTIFKTIERVKNETSN